MSTVALDSPTGREIFEWLEVRLDEILRDYENQNDQNFEELMLDFLSRNDKEAIEARQRILRSIQQSKDLKDQIRDVRDVLRHLHSEKFAYRDVSALIEAAEEIKPRLGLRKEN